MDSIRVVILTPNKRLLDVSGVNELYFPTDCGVVGVLPGHAPMMTAVGTGLVLYSQGDVVGIFKVAGGVAEITGTSVKLLVDVGEDAMQIDLDRAKRALERSESRLAAKELNHIDVKRAEASRARAAARIEASEQYLNKATNKKYSTQKND